MHLFRDLHKEEYLGNWRPEAPPQLDGIDEIELDTETNGLRWFEKDRPIGISLRIPSGKTWYLPWGHAGGNLDEKVVKRWAQRELRGKRITNLNTRFDNHMLYAWGVDLEAQGNILSDVGHYAALLNDHRKKFSLEAISQEYLGIGKSGEDLDKTRMAEYHAGQVAAYAERDVHLVGELKKVMWPLLTAQDLHRVRQLEDEVIYVTCEMERNGSPIDLELLARWTVEAEQEFQRALWKIWRDTSIKFEPTTAGWIKLFEHEHIAITDFTDKGNPSFTDDVLKRIKNPNIQLARRAARLKSLKSKYLDKYARCVGSDGILRYQLHQLRAIKDEHDDDAAGTISGRFSSTGIDDDTGVNIQQVMKVAKQRVLFGYDEDDSSHDDEIYIIRQLHIPESPEFQWLSADAMQIEYRLFADKVKSPRILEAYKKDPKASFHKMIEAQLKPFNENLTYRQCKDLNFMRIYGGGMAKLAFMMGFISKYQFEKLKEEFNNRVPKDHPLLAEAAAIDAIYNKEIPETAELLRRASNVARDRGYVFTLEGRRMRFPERQRLHKALNGVIQGSAADIAKRKAVELHKAREYTQLKLRFVVHDENDGDARTPETAARVQEVLDAQSYPQLTVPILWDVSVGKNWKEAA